MIRRSLELASITFTCLYVSHGGPYAELAWHFELPYPISGVNLSTNAVYTDARNGNKM